jgi:hypothetical protein
VSTRLRASNRDLRLFPRSGSNSNRDQSAQTDAGPLATTTAPTTGLSAPVVVKTFEERDARVDIATTQVVIGMHCLGS